MTLLTLFGASLLLSTNVLAGTAAASEPSTQDYLSVDSQDESKVKFGPRRGCGKQPPNFLFIMTDDQDLRLNSVDYQPIVKRVMADKGTTFNKHFCTVSLCCPSRVSLLTGKAAHNTNVTDVEGVSCLLCSLFQLMKQFD